MKASPWIFMPVAMLCVLGISSEARAASRAPTAHVPRFSVIEWFGSPRPHGGQAEVVHARLFSHNQPVSGVRLLVQVQNSRVVTIAHGTKTDARGAAQARFRVPPVKGATLTIVVQFTYQGTRITGRNLLHVSA